jgi:hypothetical protein
MFGAALWWRQWLFAHGFFGAAYPVSLLAAALGLMTATTFLIRRPYLMTVVLLVSAPLFLYLLMGQGPPRYAGLAYLGAGLAAWLVRRGDRP